jgi:hypothetical protein
MYFALIAAYLLLTGALLVIGAYDRKRPALYALKCLWLPGVVLAAYLTQDAWKDRSYSENWAVIGVVFFVLPFTGLVVVEGILEFMLLRGQNDSHATEPVNDCETRTGDIY